MYFPLNMSVLYNCSSCITMEGITQPQNIIYNQLIHCRTYISRGQLFGKTQAACAISAFGFHGVC